MRLAWEGFKLGVASLWSHKLRSSLTLLGHIMGVITVITLISIIQGMNQYVSEKILVQGANLFYVDKFGLVFSQDDFLQRQRRADLELAHYDRVREGNETLASVGAFIQTNARVKVGKRKLDEIGVIGLTPDSPLLDPYPLVDGRDLRYEDVEHRRRVALLGSEIVTELFPIGDPIGQTIRVGSRKYTVIGVYGERGKILGQSTDNFVAVPITEMMGWMRDGDSFTIMAQPHVDVESEEAEEEVRWLIRSARGLRPQQEDDFEVYSSDALMNLYKALTGGAFAALIGIGSIALVVGGIVIMNIMLVSVTERTREIGVRKSLGARRKDILSQFLLEALVLTLSGGAVGVAIGFSVAFLVSKAVGLPVAITAEATALGLGLSALVGMFFGIYPAMRASKLDPVTALRSE